MLREKIRLFPDPVLRRKAEVVTSFDHSLAVLLETLQRTMRAQPSGVGIAAPQVGVARQVAVVDVSPRVPGAKLLVLINPKIIDMRDPIPSREGCMSLPDYTANLKRFRWIRFVAQNPDGTWYEKTSEGIEAVCVQHEVDHLAGLLFFDRVVSLKTDMFPRRIFTKRRPAA
ncbi:MAG: peptide deformylase [Candidatus Omnitrophica bacterium]|nr:peptide deformylase [Candidatus Omnitrophota bacterium]